MRRQLVKIVTLSFIAFWIVSSLFWLQYYEKSAQQQADAFAIDFHKLVASKIKFFEQVLEFPNAVFNDNINFSLTLLADTIKRVNKPHNEWTEQELKQLALQYNLSDIHLINLSSRIIASTQGEAVHTMLPNAASQQSNIPNSFYGDDKIIAQTPSIDFRTGVLRLSAYYGPRQIPNLLISISIDIKQFDSESYGSDLIDYMFYQFFADIQKSAYKVSQFDLMFAKENGYFSLIGNDPTLNDLDLKNFPREVQLTKNQRNISAVSVIPVESRKLDYGDYVIIQSKHSLEARDETFKRNWIVASVLLMLLWFMTLFALFTYFLASIRKNSVYIHRGLDRIANGDYKSEIRTVGRGEIVKIAHHINETRKSISESERLHQSSHQDMEKLINDRTFALRQEIEERTKIESQIQEMSLTDHLTKSGNRRYFDQTLTGQFALFSRKKVPFSINLIDIDHFKQTNDIHGHPAGDAILIQLTRLISSLIRDYDCFCRIGGEEFAIILPETDLEGAKRFAQRVLEEVRKSTFIIDGGSLSTTVSIGVAEISPRDENEYALLKRADHALYKAKGAGRNRLEVE